MAAVSNNSRGSLGRRGAGIQIQYPGAGCLRTTYYLAMASEPKPSTAEAIRVQRLREDAKRPMSVNLAEGIALSHKLMRFAGAARQS